MKKVLTAALTASVVAASVCSVSAAANPFSDVPSDHWAYDAVTQLAKDGVIEGYGDTTFQGNKNITRYEMAQMVAKAMAKTNVPANDKALLDKLSAEFSDELNNLGVRVTNLERNADKVKWNGEARYTYTQEKHDVNPANGKDTTKRSYPLLLRMEPRAEINDHWFVKARFDATTNLNTDSGSGNSDNAKLQRVWAQGNYKNFTVEAGKFPYESAYDEYATHNSQISGARVNFNLGDGFSASLLAGRQNLSTSGVTQYAAPFDDPADVDEVAVKYNKSKFAGIALYQYVKTNDFKAGNHKGYLPYSNDKNENKAGNWEAAGTYRFDKNTALTGAYGENTKADHYDKLGIAQFDYKGVQRANAGTWGAYVAYKHIGGNIAYDPNSDATGFNQKGWEVGARYMLFKNTMASAKYFNGKDLSNDKDASKFFGRVEFFF